MKVVYLSQDEKYCQKLSAKLKEYKLDFTSHVLFSKNEIQDLFPQIVAINPDLIFVDFCIEPDSYLHLVELLFLQDKNPPWTIIGLHSQDNSPQFLNDCILNGLKFNFYKDKDYSDILSLLSSKIELSGYSEQFAQASLKDDIKLNRLAKVGFINQELIHFESDSNLDSTLNASFLNQNLNLKIIKKGEQTFYNLKNFYEANILKDELLQNPLLLLKEEPESKPKKFKTTIIDSDLKIFNHAKRTDLLDFIIRVYPSFSDISKMVAKTQAHIYIIQKTLSENLTEAQFDQATSDLISLLAKEEQLPFLIIFNENRKKNHSYAKLLVMEENISLEVLTKLYQKFYTPINTYFNGKLNPEESCYYFNKTNPHSVMKINQPVVLKSISETKVTLECSTPLSLGEIFELAPTPFPGYLVVSENKNLKHPLYECLLMGQTELQKNNLRHFIQDVIFRDLQKAKKEELEAFKKLNEEYIEKNKKAS